MKFLRECKADILERIKGKIIIESIRRSNGHERVSFETVFEEAFETIDNFYETLLDSPVCNFQHKLLVTLDNLHRNFVPTKFIIEQRTPMHRARKGFCSGKIVNVAPFLGLDAKESFVPPRKSVVNMRANVAYHPVLYASSDKDTAFHEIRANKNDILNLCTIEANRNLKLFNLRRVEAEEYKAGGLSSGSVFMLIIRALVGELFSESVGTADTIEEYIVTQFIAEYIKNIHMTYLRYDVTENENQRYVGSHGEKGAQEIVGQLQTPYDGIVYNSQYTVGLNYCIFNYDECKPTASKLIKVSDVTFDDYSVT
jgi:hypothetical protein